MFFPECIKSIRPADRVLEIGPGSTPYFRADEFLEYKFGDSDTVVSQRGSVIDSPDFGGRKVTFYDGDAFPFMDNEFDYVIVSHVVEHTADPAKFLSEVFRVSGGRGYIEYPLPPYEYLYDFDVHLSYVWYNVDVQELQYMKKLHVPTSEFASITSELRRGLELGWDDLVRNNLNYFFQGFEFLERFCVREVLALEAFQQRWENLGNTLPRRLVRKVEGFFPSNPRGKA